LRSISTGLRVLSISSRFFSGIFLSTDDESS
jgi:hypothetical protein